MLARKVTGYLLNEAHSDGAPKASFFRRFGFSTDRPQVLIEALTAHPQHNRVIATRTSKFGTTSVVQCSLKTPDGRDPCIRTVWMLDVGSTIQRLVTAYPARS